MEGNSTYIKVSVNSHPFNMYYGKYLFENNYSDF